MINEKKERTMKRILMTMVCALPLVAANAQKFDVGVVAGIDVNIAAGNVESDGAMVGPVLGVRGEMAIDESWYATATLQWAMKNSKSPKAGLEGYTIQSKRYLNYIELPLRLGLRMPVGADCNMLFEAGPYFGIAAWGKSKGYVDGHKSTSMSDIFGEEGFRRFDFGLPARVGLELSRHYQLFLGYDHGFVNQWKSAKNSPFEKGT